MLSQHSGNFLRIGQNLSTPICVLRKQVFARKPNKTTLLPQDLQCTVLTPVFQRVSTLRMSMAAAGWWPVLWTCSHQLGFESKPCHLVSCSLSFFITKMRMVMPDWWAVVIGEWDDACENDLKIINHYSCATGILQLGFTVLQSSAFRIRFRASTQTKFTYVATVSCQALSKRYCDP